MQPVHGFRSAYAKEPLRVESEPWAGFSIPLVAFGGNQRLNGSVPVLAGRYQRFVNASQRAPSCLASSLSLYGTRSQMAPSVKYCISVIYRKTLILCQDYRLWLVPRETTISCGCLFFEQHQCCCALFDGARLSTTICCGFCLFLMPKPQYVVSDRIKCCAPVDNQASLSLSPAPESAATLAHVRRLSLPARRLARCARRRLGRCSLTSSHYLPHPLPADA